MRPVLQSVLGILAAAASMTFWTFVARRWEGRFRERCERRYGVTITYSGRSQWHVIGPGAWYRRLGIELLQLAFFMGAFVVWAVGLLGVLGLMALVGPR